jgi:hypothetical protein
MSDRTASTVHGIELYNEVQRLLCEWHGADAGEQTALIPKLVETIVRLTRASSLDVARLACHDGAEPA